MSYHLLPTYFDGMYSFDEAAGLWVPNMAKEKKYPLCQTQNCEKDSEKARGTGRGLQCGSCRVRLWRANNPIKAVYNAVKNKARRRCIPFTLTLKHFTGICEATGYHFTRGREVGCFHLDRIDAMKGYEDGNVQVLTSEENARKSHTEYYRTYDEWEGGGGEWVRPQEAPEVEDGCDPF